MPTEVTVEIEHIVPSHSGGGLGRLQHVQMRVDAALSSLAIEAVFPSGFSEPVYDADGFTPAYVRRSAAEAEGDPGPSRLAILRDGGWPEYTVELRARAFVPDPIQQSDPFMILLF